MTTLRRRMLEDLQLRGLATQTQQCSLAAASSWHHTTDARPTSSVTTSCGAMVRTIRSGSVRTACPATVAPWRLFSGAERRPSAGSSCQARLGVRNTMSPTRAATAVAPHATATTPQPG
jgi:hypothetical protein